MPSERVSSFSRYRLVLAGCLLLSCGKVTTPGGQATNGMGPRDMENTGGKPPPRQMPNEMESDAGGQRPDDDEMGCGPSAVAGLSVVVGSPDFECDEVRVIATATDFEENLACSVRDDRCRCFGVHERPGTYVVRVEAGDPPVELVEREVVVEMDEANCHVETESVSIRVVAPDGLEDAGVIDAGGGGGDVDPPVIDGGS